ncbi:MAG: 23S rRNA (guanosine(2251)-2'-O)-methyltransferase RlmB, partial [Ferruginibacter sp.]
AFQGGQQLDRIYMQTSVHGEVIDEIKELAAKYLVPINKVPVEKLNNFNVSNHEGCIAQISKIQYQDLQQIISFVVEKGEAPLLIILDGITDIRNIGAIARSAYAMGVHAIIIPDRGIGSLNEDAILTSAGALEQIAVCRVNSLMKAVDTLHLNGIKVYASEMKAKKKAFEIDFTEPCSIILGGEEHGIYPALLKSCDEQFNIPMPGDFESLNVSVAGGISLYEVVRQRGASK